MSSSDEGPNLEAAEVWQDTLDTDELIRRALSRFFRGTGDITDTDYGFAEQALIAAHEVEQLRTRVGYLEEQVERLETRLNAETTDAKVTKVAGIVEYAKNKGSAGQAVVKLTPKEVQGAAGVSRRYAYDLVDDLPDEYEWFLDETEMQQYGQIELEVDGKRLGVDFEGVHRTPCPVNKFTTGTSQTTATDGQEG